MFDPIECAAFLLAIAMVICNARQIHWGWPLAIASSLLYVWVFANAKLYGDAALQVFFVTLALWGWRQWLGHGQSSRDVDLRASAPKLLAVRELDSFKDWWLLALWLVIWLVLWFAIYFFLRIWPDSDAPLADGFVTSGSVLATLLLARKFMANWIVWFAVNVVSVVLLMSKQLWLSALLYAVLAAMSVYGWWQWRQSRVDDAKRRT